MGYLRIWRKSSGFTQEQLASKLGENPKTYSSYERGASPIPPETVVKLRQLGYEGPLDQRLISSEQPLTQLEFSRAFSDLRSYLAQQFGAVESAQDAIEKSPDSSDHFIPEKAIRPCDIQDAWEILSGAIEKAGADIRLIDRKAFGKLLGLIAEEIAEKGFSGHTRARILEQAEKFAYQSKKVP